MSAMISDAELYRLSREEHKSYGEIARQTGLSRGTVAGRITRYVARGGREKAPLQQVDQVIDNTQANTRAVESKSIRITTLEQLIAYCQIDLEVWAVERHVINKWEVGAKDERGAIVVEPLFQVKAWLVKRRPEAIKPVIAPVNINVRLPRPPERSRGLKAALILPDTQFGFSREVYGGKLIPFHDRLALDAARQIAQVIEPDTTVLLGDVNDLSGWSDKFIHRPEFYFTTQPALIEAAWYLRQVRALTRGTVYDLEGNHDLRIETQVITHLVDAYQLRSADNLEAAPVLSIDNLLGLARMGVTYVPGYPDGEVWINPALRCIHGEKVRGQPGQTAAAVVRDANESVLFGHIHRIELATRTIPTQGGCRTVTACSPGCLCHIDGRVPGSKRSDQWQQGLAVVWYDEESAQIVPVGIHAGRAVYAGEVYQGRDYLDGLREETGWCF